MLRHATALVLVAAALLAVTGTAQAKWMGGYHPHSQSVAYVKRNLHHAVTTLTWLKNHKKAGTSRSRGIVWRDAIWQKHWAQKRLSVLQPPVPKVDYWVGRQIAIATKIAQGSSNDPWPNCPDPYDGSGSSWYDTVQCENGGNWYDSPGYYRCGLQFDPSWETKYGRLCP